MSAKHRRIYTPNEVALHNTRESCWVSIFWKVYDLSPLLAQNHGALARPVIEAAGTDVSHWFDEETKDVKQVYDEERQMYLPYVPMGRFIHVPPTDPVSNWRNDFGLPWWQNDEFCIGSLSRKTRFIRVVNTLTKDDHLLEVGSEETLLEVQDRYLDYNKHADSYSWKALSGGDLFKPLDMTKTLHDNGVIDEAEELTKLGLDPADFIPVIQIYFKDDLTVA